MYLYKLLFLTDLLALGYLFCAQPQETKGEEPFRGQAQAVVCTDSYEPRSRVIRMKVTAYCPCEECCGEWAQYGPNRLLRFGHKACEPIGVAADPELLDYGTVLEIPGAGTREVDDTGGVMRQDAKQGIYHIDVRMATHKQAKNWGVQWLDVAVLY